MSNQELQFLVKNEYQYFSGLHNKRLNINLYTKYRNIIDDHCSLIKKDFKDHNEKLYCFINNITHRMKCKICNKFVKFHSISRGYYEFCSKKCVPQCSVKQYHEHEKELKIIHNNKYKYSWDGFKNSDSKIKIFCKTCNNIFYQDLMNHKNGQGCPKCADKKRANKRKLSIKEQINQIRKVKNIKECAYFWNTYIDNGKKMKIKCMKCGNIFKQCIQNHKNGQGCPKCGSVSIGENKIEDTLNKLNIHFIRQKRFINCKRKRELPFDFYISDLNVCIEYDGIQHFESIERFGGEKQLEERKLNDKIKNNYCFVQKIKLIRIPYWDFDNIEDILKIELNI